MESWEAKIISLVILLILTVVFGFVPRALKVAGNEKYISIANCIAGRELWDGSKSSLPFFVILSKLYREMGYRLFNFGDKET